MKVRKVTAGATVCEELIGALRSASEHNRSDVVEPAAVLWTDKGRHWESVVPRLREAIPFLTLGGYEPEALTGPAIWLRCVIAGALPEVELPEGTPILYLPGIGRSELRAVEDCPKELQPLAELQYRGVVFSHPNGRDWSPAGFLGNVLGVEVAGDGATREALARALPELLRLGVGEIRAMFPFGAADLDALLVPDPERELLSWMDDPDGYTDARGSEAFVAFCQVCKSRYGFDPVSDGDLQAVQLLAAEGGPWKAVWRRYEESPKLYPNLPSLLDRIGGPMQGSLFERSSPYRPSDNRAEEDRLREALLALGNKTAPVSRSSIEELDKQHGVRRNWVWAELGQSSLAGALAPLVDLCQATQNVPGGDTPREVAQKYTEWGWKADDAALSALAGVDKEKDAASVRVAVRAVYADWLESTIRRFQEAVDRETFQTPQGIGVGEIEKGVCLLFVDGLRYDLALRLDKILKGSGTLTELGWRFTALPGVTPTAKPLLSPAAPALGPGDGFGAIASGSKVTAPSLRKAISALGYEVLERGETGDASGGAWTEFGDIDSLGHFRGWRLAREVGRSLGAVAERIQELLEGGWREVKVITDHGWLLVPDGLPKAELPEHLTATRKGRCARLKVGSSTNYQTVPWALDPEVRVAVAPGISAFEAGKEYEHGGLSPQECVVPVLRVSSATGAPRTSIAEVKWTGLRCKVRVEDAPEEATVNLRFRAADPETSLAAEKKLKQGAASVPVEDDLLEGSAALVVVLGPDKKVLAQQVTVVGG